MRVYNRTCACACASMCAFVYESKRHSIRFLTCHKIRQLAALFLSSSFHLSDLHAADSALAKWVTQQAVQCSSMQIVRLRHTHTQRDSLFFIFRNLAFV